MSPKRKQSKKRSNAEIKSCATPQKDAKLRRSESEEEDSFQPNLTIMRLTTSGIEEAPLAAQSISAPGDGQRHILEYLESFKAHFDKAQRDRRDLKKEVATLVTKLEVIAIFLAVIFTISHGLPRPDVSLAVRKLSLEASESNPAPLHELHKRSPVAPHRGHRLQASAALRPQRPRPNRSRIMRQKKFAPNRNIAG
eukprot:maker-scaffold52_size450388-snap-gene-0.13 protein:Tk02862 transcript:maker-scaffold52_size450388-snap-gene-0.13-mRNA-1 annotation:"Hypothetical protein GLP15_2323"